MGHILEEIYVVVPNQAHALPNEPYEEPIQDVPSAHNEGVNVVTEEYYV